MCAGVVVHGAHLAGRPDQEEEVEEVGDAGDEVAGVLFPGVGVGVR